MSRTMASLRKVKKALLEKQAIELQALALLEKYVDEDEGHPAQQPGEVE